MNFEEIESLSFPDEKSKIMRRISAETLKKLIDDFNETGNLVIVDCLKMNLMKVILREPSITTQVSITMKCYMIILIQRTNCSFFIVNILNFEDQKEFQSLDSCTWHHAISKALFMRMSLMVASLISGKIIKLIVMVAINQKLNK